MRRGFAPILILIIVAISVIGAFLYQQSKPKTQSQPQSTTSPSPSSTDETANPDSIGANWKTYTNTVGKFTLKYPDSWQFKIISNTNADFENEARNAEIYYEIDQPSRVYGEISVETTEFRKKYGEKEITQAELFNPKSSFWKINLSETPIACQGPAGIYYLNEPNEVIIGNVRAMVQVSHPLCIYESNHTSQITKTYYIPGNFDGSLIVIVIHYWDTYLKKNDILGVFHQILSTFKFLNSQIGPNNSDFCTLFSNSTFRSVDKHEVGLGPNGAEMGYWSIQFQEGTTLSDYGQSTFEWNHSDFSESGFYSCKNNLLNAKSESGGPISTSYDFNQELLDWDGVKYQRLK